MADANKPVGSDDPHDLGRFVKAQADDYDRALAEIRSGRKRSHWMWYIFPQFDGLGFSSTSRRYAIKSVAEAEAYLRHPVLGPRLIECVEAVLGVEGRSAFEIFGSPDDMKLRSCATLFACLSPAGSVFDRLLDQYFPSGRDGKTLRLMGIAPQAE
ncbi:MAG: DUF1810 domain-containing protein [Isosphaeraceae bacterium]